MSLQIGIPRVAFLFYLGTRIPPPIFLSRPPHFAHTDGLTNPETNQCIITLLVEDESRKHYYLEYVPVEVLKEVDAFFQKI